MPNILSLETSAESCSVCFSVNGKTVSFREDKNGRNHSELLGVFMDETIDEAKALGHLPDAVAVSAGPGSYTGLRIGVSTAKGLCFGYNIPLIAVSTLELIALQASHKIKGSGLIVPMIDARRMEVYCAKFENASRQSQDEALIIDENSFTDELSTTTLYFCGDGSDKCKEVLKSENAQFIDGIIPHANEMYPLAEKQYLKNQFADLAYFEPNYLKAFITTKSKKNVLG